MSGNHRRDLGAGDAVAREQVRERVDALRSLRLVHPHEIGVLRVVVQEHLRDRVNRPVGPTDRLHRVEALEGAHHLANVAPGVQLVEEVLELAEQRVLRLRQQVAVRIVLLRKESLRDRGAAQRVATDLIERALEQGVRRLRRAEGDRPGGGIDGEGGVRLLRRRPEHDGPAELLEHRLEAPRSLRDGVPVELEGAALPLDDVRPERRQRVLREEVDRLLHALAPRRRHAHRAVARAASFEKADERRVGVLGLHRRDAICVDSGSGELEEVVVRSDAARRARPRRRGRGRPRPRRSRVAGRRSPGA